MLREITKLGDLEIKVQQLPKEVRTIWLGDADARDLGSALRDHFTSLASLAESSDRSVSIDMSAVRFMNSSCIGFVTAFIRALARKNVHVEIVYDIGHPWQLLSSRCMKTVFAKTAQVTVTERVERASHVA